MVTVCQSVALLLPSDGASTGAYLAQAVAASVDGPDCEGGCTVGAAPTNAVQGSLFVQGSSSMSPGYTVVGMTPVVGQLLRLLVTSPCGSRITSSPSLSTSHLSALPLSLPRGGSTRLGATPVVDPAPVGCCELAAPVSCSVTMKVDASGPCVAYICLMEESGAAAGLTWPRAPPPAEGHRALK